MDNPCRTPIKSTQRPIDSDLSSPMFISPTPKLQNLGYGKDVELYRIERSPLPTGTIRSPWANKRFARKSLNEKDQPPTDEAFGNSLLSEANYLRSLDHPNIIGFCGKPSIREVLGRELNDSSSSLGDILESRYEDGAGSLEAAKIKTICRDMFNALDYLHTKAKVLHGDIKSFHILINKEFTICKLCDFGRSLPLNDDGYVDLLRKPDAKYVGVDLWRAPEALIGRNEVNISFKADMFSFGLVIYECIALIPPHTWALRDAADDEDSSFNDSSMLIDSEESALDCEENGDAVSLLCGTRPPMPESNDLSAEYNVVVELFFVCTNLDPVDRPSATSLIGIFDE